MLTSIYDQTVANSIILRHIGCYFNFCGYDFFLIPNGGGFSKRNC